MFLPAFLFLSLHCHFSFQCETPRACTFVCWPYVCGAANFVVEHEFALRPAPAARRLRRRQVSWQYSWPLQRSRARAANLLPRTFISQIAERTKKETLRGTPLPASFFQLTRDFLRIFHRINKMRDIEEDRLFVALPILLQVHERYKPSTRIFNRSKPPSPAKGLIYRAINVQRAVPCGWQVVNFTAISRLWRKCTAKDEQLLCTGTIDWKILAQQLRAQRVDKTYDVEAEIEFSRINSSFKSRRNLFVHFHERTSNKDTKEFPTPFKNYLTNIPFENVKYILSVGIPSVVSVGASSFTTVLQQFA